jgi:hypothetical protein
MEHTQGIQVITTWIGHWCYENKVDSTGITFTGSSFIVDMDKVPRDQLDTFMAAFDVMLEAGKKGKTLNLPSQS